MGRQRERRVIGGRLRRRSGNNKSKGTAREGDGDSGALSGGLFAAKARRKRERGDVERGARSAGGKGVVSEGKEGTCAKDGFVFRRRSLYG